MTCPACEQAKVGACSAYPPHCLSCRARSIARSRAAKDAWHEDGSGETKDLTDVIARMLPTLSSDAGWRLVHEWWAMDQQTGASA